MGLPRWLEDKLSASVLNANNAKWVGNILSHVLSAYPDLLGKAYSNSNLKGYPLWNLACTKYRENYRQIYIRRSNVPEEARKLQEPDEMEKIAGKLYTAIDNNGCAEFKRVLVCRYFLQSLDKYNAAREADDRRLIALRLEIAKVQSKVYKSRSFPHAMRLIIFERDDFTCQKCNRHKELLSRLGLYLQVDHRVAWEDGGQTTYSNGETLCSDCNIAKHHTKKYFRTKEMLYGRQLT